MRGRNQALRRPRRPSQAFPQQGPLQLAEMVGLAIGDQVAEGKGRHHQLLAVALRVLPARHAPSGRAAGLGGRLACPAKLSGLTEAQPPHLRQKTKGNSLPSIQRFQNEWPCPPNRTEAIRSDRPGHRPAAGLPSVEL